MAGERRCVLDRFRFRPVCCRFRVYCSNKPTRLGVRRRRPSRRIAGSSRGEKIKKNDPPTRPSGRSSGPCASAPSSSDREPVKKGSKSWSTPVCDCLEKETKTVILSDNSNEPELRARSDEATTTRCRKQTLRKEKLLCLPQRCTCYAVVVDRSPCTSSGIVSHFTVSRASCLCVHGLFRTSTRQKRALRVRMPAVDRQGGGRLSFEGDILADGGSWHTR